MRTRLFTLAVLVNLGISSHAMAAQTPANDDGGGNTIYFDRHYVNCGFNALTSLRLFRPIVGQIAFEYQCANVNELSANYHTTPANWDGGGNSIYLDRHPVDCHNKPLQFVHLYRPSSDQIAYEYNCGNKTLNNVTDHHTNWEYDGGGNTIYLDRHHMVCPAGKVLSFFKLERPFHNSNSMRYHYRCGQQG